jgi:hypothetical protein
MHAAMAPAAEMTASMTSAEMAVTTASMATTSMAAAASVAAAVTSPSTTLGQGRSRQQGCDNQNCNSNARLRHGICSGLIALPR